MSKNMTWLIVTIIGFIFAFSMSAAILASAIKQDLNDMRVQGQCISEKINAGVERRDIKLIGKTECEVINRGH